MRVVRNGIKPGEKIVVNGLQRVQPGAAVTAQLVAMEGEGKPINLAAAKVDSAAKAKE